MDRGGSEYRVTAPEGATQQDAIAYVHNNNTQPVVEESEPEVTLKASVQDVPRQLGLTARHIGSGLSKISDIPNALLNYGVINPSNYLADVQGIPGNIPNLDYPSELAQQGMDAVGLPKPKNALP
jgi:hypothetical protein